MSMRGCWDDKKRFPNLKKTTLVSELGFSRGTNRALFCLLVSGVADSMHRPLLFHPAGDHMQFRLFVLFALTTLFAVLIWAIISESPALVFALHCLATAIMVALLATDYGMPQNNGNDHRRLRRLIDRMTRN